MGWLEQSSLGLTSLVPNTIQCSCITKYSMRSYSPGNFVLTSTNRALTIEAWTGHDNQAWEYDTRSRALRSFTDGKIDFGRGYVAGQQAHCDGHRSSAWNDSERWTV